jgi:hypothetical protein
MVLDWYLVSVTCGELDAPIASLGTRTMSVVNMLVSVDLCRLRSLRSGSSLGDGIGVCAPGISLDHRPS